MTAKKLGTLATRMVNSKLRVFSTGDKISRGKIPFFFLSFNFTKLQLHQLLLWWTPCGKELCCQGNTNKNIKHREPIKSICTQQISPLVYLFFLELRAYFQHFEGSPIYNPSIISRPTVSGSLKFQAPPPNFLTNLPMGACKLRLSQLWWKSKSF